MSKAHSIHGSKPKPQAATKTAVAKAAACPPAKRAVVVGQVMAGGGKMYQVLAPVVTPRHLSMDDIELAVEMMVAAR